MSESLFTKYFKNLDKRYRKKKATDNILCEGASYRGQEGASEGITGFYQKLYGSRETLQAS